MGSWRYRAAPVQLLRAALQPTERVRRTTLEPPGKELVQQLSPPPGREREVSAKADTALIRSQRRHDGGLIVEDAEGQPAQKPGPVRAGIHFKHI
jgi:hypothetical protein